MCPSCPPVSHPCYMCGTNHGSANTGALVAPNAPWSSAPEEITLGIVDYYPSCVLALRVVSREFRRISDDFLRRNADEIIARCSNPGLPLHRFTSVCTQPGFQPTSIQFHLTLSKIIDESRFRGMEVPGAVLLPGEVDRFNNQIFEGNIRSLWDPIRDAIEQDNPGLEGIPGFDAAAEEICPWMVANPHALQGITYLELRGCPVSYIPAEMGLLTNLVRLVLKHTGLNWMSPGVFNGLPQLHRLEIGGAGLRGRALPTGTFAGLDQLRTLTLRNSQVEGISPGAFGGLTGLQELNLDDNRLGTLLPDGFRELGQLQDLSISNCQLKTLLPGAFNGLAQLTALDLSSNISETLPSDIFHGLTELRRLDLSCLRLCALPPNLFNGLPHLQVLKLHYNGGLLFFYDDLPRSNNIAVLRTIDGFFNYECMSPFAGFYQFAAGAPSREALMESFSGLNDAIKNAVFRRVYDTYPRPEPFDTRWGETHAFIGASGRVNFNQALRGFVREQFAGLTGEQRNAVYGRVYTLAQSQRGAEEEDFTDPQWGEHHAFDNIPRLIDAMNL